MTKKGGLSASELLTVKAMRSVSLKDGLHEAYLGKIHLPVQSLV